MSVATGCAWSAAQQVISLLLTQTEIRFAWPARVGAWYAPAPAFVRLGKDRKHIDLTLSKIKWNFGFCSSSSSLLSSASSSINWSRDA